MLVLLASSSVVRMDKSSRIKIRLPEGDSDNTVFISVYDMIYLLTAVGLSPGGSSTVHIYTQTIHRTTQKK